MKKVSFILMCLVAGLLSGCDAKDDLNKPKTMVRSMVIGGMPVADQDYKLMAQEQTAHAKETLP